MNNINRIIIENNTSLDIFDYFIEIKNKNINKNFLGEFELLKEELYNYLLPKLKDNGELLIVIFYKDRTPKLIKYIDKEYINEIKEILYKYVDKEFINEFFNYIKL